MKTLIAMFMMLVMITLTGCWNTSSQGGIAPTNEQFSITVPSSITLIQGGTETITVSLNRGSDFKQDVQLEINANDISVTPTSILVKSGDKPDVPIQIASVKNAALGNYILSVRGTPKYGKTTTVTLEISHSLTHVSQL